MGHAGDEFSTQSIALVLTSDLSITKRKKTTTKKSETTVLCNRSKTRPINARLGNIKNEQNTMKSRDKHCTVVVHNTVQTVMKSSL